MIPLTLWGVARELWPFVRELVSAIVVRDRQRAELALVRTLAYADLLAMRKVRGE